MDASWMNVNRLVFVVVSDRQADDLQRELVKEHYPFTKIDSTGILFQEPNLCLMIGMNDSRLSALLGLITQYCQPFQEYVPVHFSPPAGFPALSMIEARAGGALVYVLEVERFEQY
jgi:uncharacterized protein YaaQ